MSSEETVRMLTTGYSTHPLHDNEWVVVGSGPSAQFYKHMCRGRKVATVNAAVGLDQQHPDAYGVFELAAFPVFAEKYKDMVDNGVECFTRKAIISEHNPGGKMVSMDLGYNQAWENKDAGGFCSAGCAMLNAIAAFKTPPTIHMIGFDGYPGDDIDTRRRNAAMSRHIAVITKSHQRTRFVFHGDSVMPNQDQWRVERGGKI